MLEVGLAGRLASGRASGLLQPVVTVGEQARHRDEIEMGEQLLAHQALAAAVELLNFEEHFAGLVL